MPKQRDESPIAEPEDRVAILVKRWVDAVSDGRSPTVAEIAAEWPELASDLEKELRRIGLLEPHHGGRDSENSTQSDESTDDEHVERIASMLGNWRAAVANGRSPTVAEIAAEWPELASDLERILRRLGLLEPSHDHRRSVDPDIPPGCERWGPIAPRGVGGQGLVWEVQDRELPRRAALKFLTLSSADSVARYRLALEAKIISKLEHPGIVPIHSMVCGEDDRPYYVMRLVDGGQTLQKAIQELHDPHASGQKDGKNGWTLNELLRRFGTVCQTVAYAHSRGVIHRDLKPDNIMLDQFDVTLVIDWGMAKEIGEHSSGTEVSPDQESLLPFNQDLQRPSPGNKPVTIEGVAQGTPEYMSPEQADGQSGKVGTASDIYSLGSTLYTLLTGQHPFSEISPGQPSRRNDVLTQVKLGNSPKRVRAVSPSVPAPLEAICLHAMNPSPEKRYRTATEFAADITCYLEDRPVSCLRDPISVRTRRWLKRHRTIVLAGATSLVLAVVLLIGFTFRLSQEKEKLFQAKNELQIKNERLNAEIANRDRALAEAARNLGGVRTQVNSFSGSIRNLSVAGNYINHPLFHIFNDAFIRSLDPLIGGESQLTDGETKTQFAISQCIHRMLSTLKDMSSVNLPEMRAQLTKAKSLLQKYVDVYDKDREWSESMQSTLDTFEGSCFAMEGNPGAAIACSLRAFDRDERLALPESEAGIFAVGRAANDVTVVFTHIPDLMQRDRNIPDALKLRDRMLAICDRFESAWFRGDIVPSSDEQFVICLCRTQLNSVMATCCSELKLSEQTKEAAKAAIKSAKACPLDHREDPSLNRWVGVAKAVLGQELLKERRYHEAWATLLDAGNDVTRANVNDSQKSRLGAVTCDFVEAGLGILQPIQTQHRLDPPLSPEQLSEIARETLEASDSYLKNYAETASVRDIVQMKGKRLQLVEIQKRLKAPDGE